MSRRAVTFTREQIALLRRLAMQRPLVHASVATGSPDSPLFRPESDENTRAYVRTPGNPEIEHRA